MKKRTVWLIVSGFMMLLLVLVSSGSAEEPKYGGTLRISWPNDPQDFDQAYKTAWLAYTLDLTNETPAGADWAKGPAGTKELTLQLHDWPPSKYLTGFALESWEYPDPTTFILHIRKGIHFHNKPPVNGRELVADDFVVSLKRMFTMPGSWLVNVATKPISYETPDKYTVVLKFDKLDASMEYRIFSTIYIVPREVVWDETGKETEALRNWKNACGTGPFMLVDYVKGSVLTFDKNPNYWQRDPLRPKNKLPYLDRIQLMIIPELSTRIAALRTGAIDYLISVPWEQTKDLDKSNPKLRKAASLQRGPNTLYMRNDIKPFSDIRVRQALSMAIDRKAMINDLYGGYAEYLMDRFHPHALGVFTPYDKLTGKAKEVLTYDPQKAKQLLAEAGYPNGFNTEILTHKAFENEPVFVASYWDKIGVRAKIDMKEWTIFNSIGYGKKYAGLMMDAGSNAVAQQTPDNSATGHYSNFSVVTDPWWDEMRKKAMGTLDEAERLGMYRQMNIYALEQSWTISLPTPHEFVYWQPWLKNFEGAQMMGTYHYWRPFTYVWLDKN